MGSRRIGPLALCLVTLCAIGGFAAGASAAGDSPASGSDARSPVDVVVALDLSGSMKPRAQGHSTDKVINWVQKLGLADDRVGVVTFRTSSHVAQDLAPFEELASADIRGRSNANGKYTDLAAGIELAYELLKTKGRAGTSRCILLFTDGRISLPGGEASADRARKYIRAVLIPAMKQEGIRVFALIPEVDTTDVKFLRELAWSTGGSHVNGLPESWKGLGPLRTAAPSPKVETKVEAKVEAQVEPAPPPSLPQPAPPPVAAVVTPAPSPFDNSIHWLLGGAVVLLLVVIAVPIRSALRSRRRSQALGQALEEVEALRRELEEANEIEPDTKLDADQKITQEKLRLAVERSRDPKAWLS